jgi:hypothetical protein
VIEPFSLQSATKQLLKFLIVFGTICQHIDASNLSTVCCDKRAKGAGVISIVMSKNDRPNLSGMVSEPIDDRTAFPADIDQDDAVVRKMQNRAIRLPYIPKIDLR